MQLLLWGRQGDAELKAYSKMQSHLLFWWLLRHTPYVHDGHGAISMELENVEQPVLPVVGHGANAVEALIAPAEE